MASELEAAERIFLFCLASDTSITKVPGNTALTRSRLIVRGFIDREGSRIVITPMGRDVLVALVERK